jgi:hypothetical protein
MGIPMRPAPIQPIFCLWFLPFVAISRSLPSRLVGALSYHRTAGAAR